jgi:hypothetical protein
VNEECFQKTPLKFATDRQWLQWSPLRIPGAPRLEIPLVKTSEGTYPPGSEWARNPVPACNFCDQSDCGDPLMMPNWTDPSGQFPEGAHNITYYGGREWIKSVRCGVICAGEDANETFVNSTGHYLTSGQLCGDDTQFPEAFPGVSGFVMNATYLDRSIDAFSIVDWLTVPLDLEPGPYLLSWRWDCEQSPQIWQNCADIQIEVGAAA